MDGGAWAVLYRRIAHAGWYYLRGLCGLIAWVGFLLGNFSTTLGQARGALEPRASHAGEALPGPPARQWGGSANQSNLVILEDRLLVCPTQATIPRPFL